jgi:hypothetical protein
MTEEIRESIWQSLSRDRHYSFIRNEAGKVFLSFDSNGTNFSINLTVEDAKALGDEFNA